MSQKLICPMAIFYGLEKMIFLLYIVIGMLVLVQGGFFEQTIFVSDILLLAVCLYEVIMNRKLYGRLKEISKVPVLCLMLLLLCYFISGMYHHTLGDSLRRILYIIMILLLYLFMSVIDGSIRERLLRYIVYIGVCESIIGVFCYLGVTFPMQSVIVNSRFMGTFQYANATALFMGIVLIVQRFFCLSDIKCVLKFRLLMLIMLGLTFSAGGIFCYVVAMVLLHICIKGMDFSYLIYDCISMCMAGALAFGIYFVKFRLNCHFLVIAVLFGIGVALGLILEKFDQRVSDKIKFILFIVLGFLVIMMGVGLFGKRILGTGLERFQQMWDGIAAILHHPFMGVGVDRWKDYITKLPAVTYEVSLVHNSYIQIGVEAGIVAILMFTIFLTCLWRNSACVVKDEVLKSIVLFMACFHCFFDITFFFGGIVVCVMVCGVYNVNTEIN